MTTSGDSRPSRRKELAGLLDFSDRRSPVMVRELRQALRAQLFVIPFLVLHGLLVLACLQGPSGGSGFFWTCLALMFVCLLPARSIGALGEERQANTLDTLILTNLSPWKIVWGKWSAVTARSLLTAVSAVPYLLVRYFNNGSSLVPEAGLLLLLLLLSGAMAGVLTGLSVIRPPLLRNGLSAVLFVAGYAAVVPGLIDALERDRMPPWPATAGWCTAAAWATAFSLRHAAAAISPAATNAAAPRRLTTLAALLFLVLLLVLTNGSAAVLHTALLLIIAAAGIVEMGERQPERTPPGRGGLPAAVFLKPGWPSGVFFSLMLWTIVLPAVILAGSAFRTHEWAAVAGACFFPVTARCLLPARARFGTAPMILLTAVANVLYLLCLEFFPAAAGPEIPWPALTDRHRSLLPALIWGGGAALLALVTVLRGRQAPDGQE